VQKAAVASPVSDYPLRPIYLEAGYPENTALKSLLRSEGC